MTRVEGNLLLSQIHTIADAMTQKGIAQDEQLVRCATGLAALGGMIVGMIDRGKGDAKEEVVQ